MEKRYGLPPGLSYENTFEGRRYVVPLTHGLRLSHLMEGLDRLESLRGTCDIIARLWLTAPRLVRRWG